MGVSKPSILTIENCYFDSILGVCCMFLFSSKKETESVFKMQTEMSPVFLKKISHQQFLHYKSILQYTKEMYCSMGIKMTQKFVQKFKGSFMLNFKSVSCKIPQIPLEN